MTAARLLVLGPIQAELDGAATSIGGRRCRAVLALLVANLDAPVRAELMADVIWEQHPPVSWRNTLQTYLSRLRAGLQLSIERCGDSYVLRHRGCEVDVRTFEEHRSAGLCRIDEQRWEAAVRELRCALALWRGPAFDGLTDLDGVRERASRLDEQRLAVAEMAAEVSLELGDTAAALDITTAVAPSTRFHDRLTSLRAEAMRRGGRRIEALAELHAYRRRMVAETGLAPGPDVQQVEQRLLEDDDTVPGIARPDFPIELTRARPTRLLSRSSSLQAARTARQAARGGCTALFVRGEAGAGKTSLAAVVAAEAHTDGWGVIYGRATEITSSPHRMIAHAVRGIDPGAVEAVGDLRHDLHGLLPDIVAADARRPTADPATRLARFHAALAKLLEAAASASGLLVVLDDLQWASPTELAAIEHLIEVSSPGSVMVLGLVRGEFSSNAADILVEDLVRRGLATAYTLQGLARAAVVELFREQGLVLDDAAIAAAVRATGGNPLLLTELARTCVSTDEVHRWVAPEQLDVPRSIARLALDRVRGTEDVGQLLQWAALIGDHFEQHVLERACGRTDALAVLEAAAAAHLVDELSPGRWAFRHSLIRQALGSTLTRSRRARYHAAIADVLESIDRSGVAADRAAYHRCQAATPGDTSVALDRSLAAARRCLDRFAPHDAKAHVARALAVASLDIDPEPFMVASLHLAEAEANDVLMDEPARKQAAEESFRWACRAGSTRLAVDSALVRNSFWTQGVVDDVAAGLIESALTMTDDPGDQIALRSSLAGMSAVSGERVGFDAVTLAERATAQARAERPDLWVTAASSLVVALWGRPATRRQAVIASQISARGGPDGPLYGARWGAAPRLALGDRPTFERMAKHLRDHTERRGLDAFRAYGLQCGALSALLDGRWADAERIGAAAVETAHGHTNFERVYLAQRFWIATETDRLGELLPVARSIVAADDLHVFRAMLGLILCGCDAPVEAAEILDELAAREFQDVPRDILWLATIAAGAEISAHRRIHQHADSLEALLRPFANQLVVVAGGAFVYGAVDRFRGMLAALAGRTPRAIDLFERAARLERSIGGVRLAERTLAWQRRALGEHDGRPQPTSPPVPPARYESSFAI